LPSNFPFSKSRVFTAMRIFVVSVAKVLFNNVIFYNKLYE
jgi:hypothetical protein